MPPTTPETSPATGEAHHSQRGGSRGARRVTLRTTKSTTKPPRISVTVREVSTVSRWVPATMPTAPNATTGSMRRTTGSGAPPRTSCTPSITMFGHDQDEVGGLDVEQQREERRSDRWESRSRWRPSRRPKQAVASATSASIASHPSLRSQSWPAGCSRVLPEDHSCRLENTPGDRCGSARLPCSPPRCSPTRSPWPWMSSLTPSCWSCSTSATGASARARARRQQLHPAPAVQPKTARVIPLTQNRRKRAHAGA